MMRQLLKAGATQIDSLLKNEIALNSKVEQALIAKATSDAIARTWQHLYMQQAINYEYTNKRLMEIQGNNITIN